jgi:hypothetical protein
MRVNSQILRLRLCMTRAVSNKSIVQSNQSNNRTSLRSV